MGNNCDKSGFPPWIRCRLSCETSVRSTVATLERLALNTVCQSAHCPNIAECFSRKTATFLILGNVCTRSCRFCAVRNGQPEPLDTDEPERVARAVAELGLRHAVITSVTRDDLPDGGGDRFAETVRTIRTRCQGVTIEVLVPDFRGDAHPIESVVNSRPDVFAHNIETVPRLYGGVRPGADYDRSLAVLEVAKRQNSEVLTKSGIMVGMGESWDEVVGVMKDLRSARCDVFTIGQYLSPSKDHYQVAEFVPPSVFEKYATVGGELGFKHVASGPLVRSSYMADAAFLSAGGGDLKHGVRSESAGYR
jgi:lipoic acid synthetase